LEIFLVIVCAIVVDVVWAFYRKPPRRIEPAPEQVESLEGGSPANPKVQ